MTKILCSVTVVVLAIICFVYPFRDSECLYTIPDGSEGWFFIVEKKDASDAVDDEGYQFDASQLIVSERQHPRSWVTEIFRYECGSEISLYVGEKNEIIYRGSLTGTFNFRGNYVCYHAFFIGKEGVYQDALRRNIHVKLLEEKLRSLSTGGG